jgi:Fe-S-cluster containining protein
VDKEMKSDLIQIRQMAEEKEDENWRFRQFLKARCNLPEAEIDRRVFAITKRVWAGIDCATCANCCREVHPSFTEEDVTRIARRLEISREEFIARYLEVSDSASDSPWQTRTVPCPFLADNKCTIYDDRLSDCRGYPYLDKAEFISRTMSMIERTFTCPIVYEVLEQLKVSCRFPRGKTR